MPAQPSRKRLRADALENRERILRAAREAFTAQGIDVPLTTIARRAGVGPATLYRRFPSRADLVTEAFAEQLAHCAAILDEALADPDPWHGFSSFVERVCAMQAIDRGFTAAFLARFPGAIDYDGVRARAESALATLVRRAKDAGRLRDDFDPADLTLLLLANAGVTGGPPEVARVASQRLVAYLLRSFQPGGDPAMPPPAPLRLEQIHGR